MSKLNAFIGHSFTPGDEEVVRKFLKFFNQVKDMNIGFTWVHAEPAEPKILADKVKHLMENKNLFIGICTNKEAVIDPSKLKKGVLNKKYLRAEETEFSSKTSDWIIQEIGLAIGRHMTLLLLIEEGLRHPGGLQGDLEHITFKRTSPEMAFGKILEMIQTQIPKAIKPIEEEKEKRAVPKEKLDEEKKGEDKWEHPEPNWKWREYRFALINMLVKDNDKGAEQIYTAYLETQDAKEGGKAARWEACREYFRIVCGKGGKLNRLEELARANPENSDVQKYLAFGYREYHDEEKAARYFVIAAEKAQNPEEEVERFSDAIKSLIRIGSIKEANNFIARMKKIIPQVEDGDLRFINSLREIANHEGDKDLLFGLSEQLLNLKPADISERFSLAYKYSQSEENEMSLYHYLMIPSQEREAVAWNNLGVDFDHFGLPNKSVESYKKAEELGGTLAMSNLAYKFIKAGFLKEAEEICQRALNIPNCHKNVNEAISRLKDIPDEEENKKNEIFDKVKPLREFYREYGCAALKEDLNVYSGQWKGPDCELSIKIKEKQFLATGTYSQPDIGLGLLGGLLGRPSTTPPKMKWYTITYKGTVVGRSVKCLLTRKSEEDSSKSPSLLGKEDKGNEVLMVISDSMEQIRFYQKENGKDPKFDVLTRLEQKDLL